MLFNAFNWTFNWTFDSQPYNNRVRTLSKCSGSTVSRYHSIAIVSHRHSVDPRCHLCQIRFVSHRHSVKFDSMWSSDQKKKAEITDHHLKKKSWPLKKKPPNYHWKPLKTTEGHKKRIPIYLLWTLKTTENHWRSLITTELWSLKTTENHWKPLKTTENH